jgi:3-mercaptopyruvate sulfurtransferase SseA
MKHSLLRNGRKLFVSAAFVSAMAVLSACGGGGSYEAPEKVVTPPASTTPEWWATYDEPDETVVSATDVAEWIKNGFKTTSGKTAAGQNVLVLDTESSFETDPAKADCDGDMSDSDPLTGEFGDICDRIIGSTSYASITGYSLHELRAEGPVNSTMNSTAVSARMVVSGATIDTMLQNMGVTKDTVIVLTSKKAPTFNLTRLWWELYYWGFSEKNIKILDGGVAALKAADASLVDQATASVVPVKSDFTVKSFPGLHDAARITTKEVIAAVKAGSANIIDVRGSDAQATPGIGEAFQGRISGAITATSANGIAVSALQNADGTFKTKAETEATFKTAGITFTKPIIVHCYSGYSAAPLYYYIKEVLGYNNVALYDGSWSAWASHAGFTPVAAAYMGGTTATQVIWKAVQFVLSADNSTAVASSDIVLGGPLKADVNANIMAYDTVKVSANIKFNNTTSWKDVYGNTLNTVNPNYTGTGNEIEEADAAYIKSDDVKAPADSDDDDSDDESVTPVGGGAGGC